MYLVLFLYIAAFFSLALGEFGQFPFGRTDFSISLTDILLSLSLTGLLIWNIGIKKNLKLPRNFLYIVIFWSVCILSLFFSLDLSGWFYFMRFVIYSSVVYLTYHLVKSRILGLGEFLILIKITGASLAIIGLLQLIFFPDLEQLLIFGFDPHKNRIVSTFLDPNFFGAFMNFTFVLFIYELLIKKSKNIQDFARANVWKISGVFLTGVVIILTFSRSAYLMLAAALVLTFLIKSRKLLIIFISFFMLLYFIFPPFTARINGAVNVDKSASERFNSWNKGIEIFQQNPVLGVGFNNVRNYAQSRNLVQLFSIDGGNSGAGIDSSLIFILATTGLTGFVFFILFLCKTIIDIVTTSTLNIKSFYNLQFKPVKFKKRIFELPILDKWYRENGGKPVLLKDNFLALPLLSLTFGLIINSFFINSLFYPPVLFLWFSMIGIYYGLAEGEGEGS